MFFTEFGDVKVYPLNKNGDFHMALSQYFKEVGVIISLHTDNAKDVEVRNKRKRVISEEGKINTSCTEPHRPQHNDAV